MFKEFSLHVQRRHHCRNCKCREEFVEGSQSHYGRAYEVTGYQNWGGGHAATFFATVVPERFDLETLGSTNEAAHRLTFFRRVRS